MTLLLLLFGIPPALAVGSDLWFAALTKLGAVALHQQRGVVDWQVVRRLWRGGLPASTVMIVWLGAQERESY